MWIEPLKRGTDVGIMLWFAAAAGLWSHALPRQQHRAQGSETGKYIVFARAAGRWLQLFRGFRLLASPASVAFRFPLSVIPLPIRRAGLPWPKLFWRVQLYCQNHRLWVRLLRRARRAQRHRVRNNSLRKMTALFALCFLCSLLPTPSFCM